MKRIDEMRERLENYRKNLDMAIRARTPGAETYIRAAIAELLWVAGDELKWRT